MEGVIQFGWNVGSRKIKWEHQLALIPCSVFFPPCSSLSPCYRYEVTKNEIRRVIFDPHGSTEPTSSMGFLLSSQEEFWMKAKQLSTVGLV